MTLLICPSVCRSVCHNFLSDPLLISIYSIYLSALYYFWMIVSSCEWAEEAVSHLTAVDHMSYLSCAVFKCQMMFLKWKTDKKINFNGWIYLPLRDTRYVFRNFEIYHINKEISHSKWEYIHIHQNFFLHQSAPSMLSITS